MPKTRLTITLETSLLRELDQLVSNPRFNSRSQAIEAAVAEKIARTTRTRLASECAKLDRREERAFAEEGLNGRRVPKATHHTVHVLR